jgi:hypothetical protein
MKNAIKNANQTAFKLIGILSIVFVVAAFILPTYALANGDTNSNSSLLGDINGDGQVNILDFTLLKLMLLGQETPTDSADVDGNGIINTLDLDALLDQFFGKASTPHGGGGGGGGAAVTNQVNFELSTYMSSYGPGTTGHTFTAQVKIAQTPFLYNGSFTVDYNSSILKVNDVTNGLFATTCVINMTNGSDWTDTPGQLTVFPNLSSCAINGTGVSGSGYFCDVLFETKGAGTSPLTMGNGTLYQSQSGNISTINGTIWINSSVSISQLYSLNATSTGHGIVFVNDHTDPYTTHTAGEVVRLLAPPDPCYHFVNWTGDTGTIANPNAASTTITMNGDYSIQANFAIDTYTLSVTASPGAGGSPSFDGISPFNCSVNATIHANTNPCYTFSSWSPTAGVANPSAKDTTVTMTQNRNLTASYVQKQNTLTMSNDGHGTTTPSTGLHTYGCGTNVSVSAQANTCYVFDQWTGTAVDAGKVANPSASSTTVTVDGNYTLQANFVTSDTFALTLVADPPGGGAPYFNGSSPFDCGTVVPIHANPDSCYTFNSWMGPAVDAGKVANAFLADTTVRMDSAYTVTAHYHIKTYVLTTAVSPVGAGTVVPSTGPHDCNASVQVTANPTGLYVFDHWSGDLSGNTSPTSILMNGSKSVTANFIIPPSVYCQNVGTRTAGTNFSLSINATNLAPDFTSGQLLLKYNPSVITVNLIGNVSSGMVNSVSIPIGPFDWRLMGLDGQTPDQQGSISISTTPNSPVSGSGYLCTISFHAVSSGTTGLEFFPPYNSQPGANCKLNDNEAPTGQLNITWVNGSVTVQ